MTARALLLRLAVLTPLLACACVSSPVYRSTGISAEVAVTGYRERGEASYYGEAFHGRTTANGEVFDMHAMTCAHLTLPFGTVLRVTNLDNERQVTVRVNDRGPYHGDRILDLSRGAAEELGMISSGTAEVIIEVVGGDG